MGSFLKVAFVGSHGVGKTTLVESLKRTLNLGPSNVVEETATKVFELSKTDPSVRINQDSNMEGQLHIMGLQIQDENEKTEVLKKLKSENPYSSLLLCDRAVLDAVVYTNKRLQKGERYIWGKNLAYYLFDWVVDSISPYNLIFYIPISFPLTSSDVRPLDIEFQEEIDAAMQELYVGHVLNERSVKSGMSRLIWKTIVLSGPIERRLALAKSHIDELLTKKNAIAKSEDYSFG